MIKKGRVGEDVQKQVISLGTENKSVVGRVGDIIDLVQIMQRRDAGFYRRTAAKLNLHREERFKNFWIAENLGIAPFVFVSETTFENIPGTLADVRGYVRGRGCYFHLQV